MKKWVLEKPQQVMGKWNSCSDVREVPAGCGQGKQGVENVKDKFQQVLDKTNRV